MFSKYLFWDVKNINYTEDKEFIILRVLFLWNLKDWKKLVKIYWQEEIVNVINKKWYQLPLKTLKLAETIFNTKFNINTFNSRYSRFINEKN